MKLEVIIQKDNNRYELVINPDKDYPIRFSLFGEGNTLKEAQEDFLICHEDMKALYADEGKEYPDLEFVFKYDLVSFLEYYSGTLGYSSLEKITGVNQRQLSQYLQGYRNPSEKTTKKIEKGIKAFAEELSQVQFV